MMLPINAISEKYRMPGGAAFIVALRHDDIVPTIFEANDSGLEAALCYVIVHDEPRKAGEPKDGQ